ncbi:MAG: hypothetical protein ACQET6_07685 [Bacillota bacterium]|uniref:hypothetical protein n=1 Tax=Rossellomorea sp. FM04394 TaxID=3243076 RepID=UPI0035A59533
MNISIAAKIMNKAGKQITIEPDKLVEINPPYENYHYLKKVREEWEFGLLLVERQEIPNEKVIKLFKSEKEAAVYFLMNRLSAFYFAKRIRPFMMKQEGFDIGGPEFNERKFHEAIYLVGIPPTLFSLNETISKANRIIVEVEGEDEKFIVKYRGEDGKTISSTLPVSKKRALFFAFKKLFLFHLFNKEIKDLLLEHGEGNDITDEDISVFLT